MTNHWVKNLMEAGRSIQGLGEAQERRLQRIADLKKQIKQLEEEYANAEDELQDILLNPDPNKGWTAEEINSARRGEKVW